MPQLNELPDDSEHQHDLARLHLNTTVGTKKALIAYMDYISRRDGIQYNLTDAWHKLVELGFDLENEHLGEEVFRLIPPRPIGGTSTSRKGWRDNE